MRTSNIIKMAASICFVLLASAIALARNVPAGGYEPSIYSATPSIIWGIVVLSAICGISIVVHQVYAKAYKNSKLWTIGLLLVSISYTTILSLWIIRGYPLWCPGDPLTHLGVVQNVLSTGHIEEQNFYPVIHIYSAQVSQVAGIPVRVLHGYIPLLFGLLFIVYMHSLAKSITTSKGVVILATLASFAPLHGWYLNYTPNHLSNLYLPLAIFILVRSFTKGTTPWKVLFIVMILVIPIFHPVPGFVLLLILLTLWLGSKMLGSLRREAPRTTKEPIYFNTTASLLLLVWGITWLSSFFVWDATIRNVHTLITEGGTTHLGILVSDIQYAQGYGYSVIEQFLKVYGGVAAYVLLAAVALHFVRKKVFQEGDSKTLISLYGPLVAIALSVILLYFLKLSFGPLRLLVYLLMICIVLTGYMLCEVLSKGRSFRRSSHVRKLIPVVVVVILVAAFVSGLLKLYPSPYVHQSNWQVTEAEIAGMDWFLRHKNASMPITGLTVTPGRFADFLLTPEERGKHSNIPSTMERESLVPYHFGYDETPSLAESYFGDTYMLLNEKDRLLYREVFPEVSELRFRDSDFGRLEYDVNLDKLYSDGGLEVWYIRT